MAFPRVSPSVTEKVNWRRRLAMGLFLGPQVEASSSLRTKRSLSF